MPPAQVPAPPGAVLVRESWRSRIISTVLIAAFMTMLVLKSDGFARVAWLVFGVLLLGGELYRSVRPVATLTPDKIAVHNIRPREVPWPSVRDIVTEKGATPARVMGVGAERIVLVLKGGERVVLEGPSGSLFARPQFQEAVETIRTYWQGHRSGRAPAAPKE